MSLSLTERQEREIEMFCRIARENGAVVSLRELMSLAAIELSERELERVFLADSRLGSMFLLEEGYVLERHPMVGGDGAVRSRVVLDEEARKRERARRNLMRATRFGRTLVRGTVLVSVSGANSYLSAAEREDIDFFCVTKTNGMWPFMLKGMILARIHRLANRDVPELCFSCVMDERWASQEFKERQHAIFARDALTAKVIGGWTAYRQLLEQARWMESYFPAFYRMRLRDSGSLEEVVPMKDDHAAEEEGGSRVLNSFLYLTLGSFLRLKSWALNRRLTKASRHPSIFETRIGRGYFIYESNRYRKLRRMYGEIEEKEEEA